MIVKAINTVWTGEGRYKPGDIFSISDEDAKRLLGTGAVVKMDRKVNVSIKTNLIDTGDNNDH